MDLDYFVKSLAPYNNTLYNLSKKILLITPIIITMLGILNGIPLKDNWVTNHPTITKYLEIIRYYQMPLYVFAGIFMAVFYKVNKIINIETWKIIKFILDEFQQDAFSDNQDDPKDHHRITLFQKKRVWFKFGKVWFKKKCFSHCLIPVMRSGELSQKPYAKFPLCDNSDDNEGVAARVYSTNRALSVVGLPELDINKKNSKTNIANYMTKTFCTKEMIDFYINNNRPMPRSIAAFPLTVNGYIWGVVVLDSRLPNSISEEYAVNYNLTVSLIEKLLEKL